MGKVYLQIFVKTAGALALAALVAAQGMDWAGDAVGTNAAVLGWSLLGAAIGGLIAVAWAFVSSPAVTPVGRALRSAVQAIVTSPLAALAYDKLADVDSAIELAVPTLIYAVLAFFVSYLGNFAGSGATTAAKPAGSDFLGTAPSTP